MNHLKKQLLCFTLLVNATHLFGAANTTTNIVPRSQSFDAARQMVGWNNPEWGINRRAADDRYFTSFNLTFAYTRTFRGNRLAQCLFGDDLICGACNDLGINISGSAVSERAATDWLGDYFGLPLGYKSTVTFKPTISNFILDFSFYAGLDAWSEGLYFRIHSPFVRTKWKLNATETSSLESNTVTDELAAAGALYPAGYFSSEIVPAGNGTASFLAYANGCTPDITNGYICNATTTGSPCNDLNDIIWQPLCCSRIVNSCDCEDNNTQTRNGFGEIRFVIGRNFFSNDADRDCHVGIGAYAAAPTGTRVGESRYLFEPIVGNGKHWELGGQVTAHHICWRSEDENRTFGMYLEANVTHLFGACQTRCFDLCSAGSNSRYMLAQRLQTFNPSIAYNANDTSTFHLQNTVDYASLEFGNEYAPVANLTRRDIISTIAAQGDLAISFAYKTGNFQWDVGYNFWGRSCEEIRVNDKCCPVIPGTWTLKGNAYVYGFQTNEINNSYNPIALAVSDSAATIHGGSNNILLPTNINKFMDNSVLAVDNNGGDVTIRPGINTPIYTSNPPVLIEETDFDFTGTRGISQKFFTNFNYARPEFRDTKWTPYVGIGAEVEFGSGSDKNCCATNCNTDCAPAPICSTIKECCSNCALTQWGIWLKMGASYN